MITREIVNNPNHYNGENRCLYITVHETGNSKKGANAKAHANLLKNGYNITWHYTVDDTNIIQHFEDYVQCWHCGDGKGNGNLNSIGIEMCVNSDNDFNKTIDNTIKLIKYLMSKHNIPISNVVQHNKWGGKNCPQNIRANKPISWTQFLSKITVASTPTNVGKDVDTGEVILERIARQVLKGDYGNGNTRKMLLGKLYDLVQEKVQEIK